MAFLLAVIMSLASKRLAFGMTTFIRLTEALCL